MPVAASKSRAERIYLDNASTTQMVPEVSSAMQAVVVEAYANPSAIHRPGSFAARRLEWAREVIAERLQCAGDEILFTSGGTEANNFALKGVLLPLVAQRRPAHLVVGSIEHPSILRIASWLESWGVEVTRVVPDSHGQVTAAQVVAALRPHTALVSIMQANNEVGTLQPVAEIGRACRAAGVLFHTDACQSFPREPLLPAAMAVDLATLNAHKLHGPKGVGALYVREGVALEPLLHGGGQERGLRSGTHNTPGIVGMARAVELITPEETERLRGYRDRLLDEVQRQLPWAVVTGHRTERLVTVASFAFPGCSGKEIQRALDVRGITVATGSACSSGSLAASPVLLALGLDERSAHGAIRVSVSRQTTEQELEIAIQALVEVVEQMRAESTLSREPSRFAETT